MKAKTGPAPFSSRATTLMRAGLYSCSATSKPSVVSRLAQVLRGAGLVAGRVLRIDRDEVREFALHAGDVG